MLGRFKALACKQAPVSKMYGRRLAQMLKYRLSWFLSLFNKFPFLGSGMHHNIETKKLTLNILLA